MMIRNTLVALAIVALAACGSGNSQGSSSSSGSITAAGSTALLPLMKQAVQDYAAINPNAKISVSGGGSGVGITQVAQKGIDIGDSDIAATGAPGLVDHRVAVVSFAVIADSSAGLKSLTKQQVADIFTGKITNFKLVGGKDQLISVINRPRNSGTRAVFSKLFLNGAQPIEGGGTQDSSGTVAQMVTQIPGAISYVATSYVHHEDVTVVAIGGSPATDANVISGKYPFWSYEHLYTAGVPRKPVADFIAFVANDKSALSALGFIPIAAMKTK